jgi:hypothetical protein
MVYDPPLPPDFPEAPYSAIQKRVSVDLKESYPDSRREFAGGWNGLRYRYLACSDHDREFTLSIERASTALERYHQERDLYGFFVNGQSAIECLCYGLHAIASILRPADFPISTQDHLKAIKWHKVAKKFAMVFPGEELTDGLDRLLKSNDFTGWQELRNILAHRATPGRGINVGGPRDGIIEWSNIELDKTTTVTRRRWLSQTVDDLLHGADKFTFDHITVLAPAT